MNDECGMMKKKIFIFFLCLFTGISAYCETIFYNNTYPLADVLIPDYEIIGRNSFENPGDENWVMFYGIAGQTYNIEIINVGEQSDVVLELYISDGMTQLGLINEPIAAGVLNWICPEDNIYYIRTYNRNSEAYGVGTEYDIVVSKASPAPSFAGFIQGIVRNAYTQTPIGGVKIKTDVNASALSYPDTGGYLMIHPAGGPYKLTAEAEGYKLYEDTVEIGAGEITIKNIDIVPENGKIATPEFSPPQGTYTKPQNVEISCDTPDVTIYYTIDGTEPEENSLRYENSLVISRTTIIKAKAFRAGFDSSDTAKAVYNITGAVEKPIFSPLPGTYPESLQVWISCPTADATIFYTTDGSEPSESSTQYTTSITVYSSTTIKAKAFREGWTQSNTITGTYIITGTVSQPAFYPEPGIYNTPQMVMLSCLTDGAIICYTTDGSEPTQNSLVYAEPISVSKSMLIHAKAFKAGWTSSSMSMAFYKVTGKVENPVFSPVSGTYTEPQNIEIFCPTSGATIYYTTDGSDPSENSQVYTASISVSSSITIKAKAIMADWDSTETVSSTYEILPVLEPIVFSPPSNIYESPQQIKISCSTPGVKIYYTIDGTEPTQNSRLYYDAILVYEALTIKAKAFLNDRIAGDTVKANYVIVTVESPESGSGGCFISSMR